jgi:hypothetical protein
MRTRTLPKILCTLVVVIQREIADVRQLLLAEFFSGNFYAPGSILD